MKGGFEYWLSTPEPFFQQFHSERIVGYCSMLRLLKKPAIDVNFINDGQLDFFWAYIELTLDYIKPTGLELNST